MRILLFSPRYSWPPNTGAGLRDYHLARELAKKASVTFVGLAGVNDKPELSTEAGPSMPAENEIFERTIRIRIKPTYTFGKLVRGIIGPPVTVLNYFDQGASVELQCLMRETKFDSVQIEGVHLIKYLPSIRGSRFHPPVLCDWHNIESQLLRRYSEHSENWLHKRYALRTARLLENTEVRLLSECDAHITVSQVDRLKLEQTAPSARIFVIENGVDVESYANERFDRAPQNLSDSVRNTLVFVGSMNYHANIDAASYFAREVWPRIQVHNPALSFWIVGSRPTAAVRALSSIRGVNVTGTVPDVRPYYRKALAAVVPLRVGGGSRLKILEAMAAGVPVVSTTIGAEGLRVIPRVTLAIADTAEEMSQTVIRLANSRESWQAFVVAGSELVKTGYDWPLLGSQLYDIHKSLTEKRTMID
jgi:glycosyltransferase involved in cell wall biosynthesis